MRAGIVDKYSITKQMGEEQGKREVVHMTKRIISIFLCLSLILTFFSLASADGENYCHDKKSWEQWQTLIEKNSNDTEIQTLHALRIGLCVKVNSGEITLNRATDIFESAREAIIQKRKEDQKREKDRQKL